MSDPSARQCASSSRRSFLKQSSATAATSVMAASIARRAYAADNNDIKVALIGCSGFGTAAAKHLLLSTQGPVTLHVMCDAFEDSLEQSLSYLQREAEHNNDITGKIDVPPERQFTGLDGYKKAIDSGADLVVLTTPPGFRPLQFEYAVKQGKHVFMANPLAVDAAGVRRVLAAAAEARQKNLKVGVGLQRRHQASYLETIKRLHDGAIGDITCMRVYWDGGGVKHRGRQSDMTEMQHQVLNWYYFNWLSGDHIVEQHVHNLDVANWVIGKHPIAAQGMGGRQVRTGSEYGQIYDHFAVEFIYDNDVRVISNCRQIKGCYNSVSEYAHGARGMSTISSGIIEPAGGPKWRFRNENPNPYQVQYEDLQRAIRNNLAYNEAEYAATSTMTGILGRMAAYSGKLMRWDIALSRGRNLAPGIDRYDWNTRPPVVPNAEGLYPIPMPGTYDPLEPETNS
ncbi:Gfo/Idh/MocA family oxidoreductase [Planctomycetales bacterium ZRK34]|nr:Gfo/Idh/MocA family oxidoreductase [Planctomycetales bacterium ZRK34]